MIEVEDEPCAHDKVIDQERLSGIMTGRCEDCGQMVAATGDEDEAGVPGWEVTE